MRKTSLLGVTSLSTHSRTYKSQDREGFLYEGTSAMPPDTAPDGGCCGVCIMLHAAIATFRFRFPPAPKYRSYRYERYLWKTPHTVRGTPCAMYLCQRRRPCRRIKLFHGMREYPVGMYR
ncbi:hypothetical protein LY76DRAFT_262146 [Colletotrichum caudatum]|nr:hypothetical protein LY76DRAFT_262146 [Colletotrichum caudatum]